MKHEPRVLRSHVIKPDKCIQCALVYYQTPSTKSEKVLANPRRKKNRGHQYDAWLRVTMTIVDSLNAEASESEGNCHQCHLNQHNTI